MSSDWSQSSPDLPPMATEPPPPLLRGVNLMYVGAGLSVIGVVIGLLNRDGIREQVRESLVAAGLEVTEEAINSGVAVAMGLTVVLGAIGVGLWILMATMNRKGKTWARTTATVLGGLAIVSNLSAMAASGALGIYGGSSNVVLAAINLALAGAILYFLWRPENGPYYAYNSQRR